MTLAGQNRVALVSGGAKRVGRAIVETLAQGGFDIAFTYLSSAGDAEAVVEVVKKASRTCIAIRADLTDPAVAGEAIHQAVAAKFGRLDVLVNNASLYLPGGLDTADVAQSRRMWAIHVESPMVLCQKFAPMLRQARGHVVNMVDLLAERPWPKYLAYSASKAGLWNLTLGLAREMAPEVTVNGIAPGVVEWPADYPEAEKQKYLKRVPLARAGTPGDVARTVQFLCTAGSYITGQIIRLDGGRSIT
jgi:pteridine reductase